jgi:DNA (cytosine-5)-methyltransferase 1
MHSNNPIIPYISLCSGYEGIGLGLHRCIPNLRCVAYCEREAFAIANLVAKMESGLLDAAPVFTDVTNFPWADYAPYMAGGILSFGWPCQPVSTAGKRKATEDERWLFDIIADGISILHPGMLFAENVEGLLSARMPDGSSVFGHCIERLESLHYKVAAGIFSASEVGAPHQRKRVFILAYDKSQRIQGHWADWLQESRPHAGQGLPLRGGDAGCLANSNDQHGHGEERGGCPEEDRISSEHREEEHPRRELGRADAKAPWPSRPGEQQHGWEPPRVVVADPKRSRGEESEHLDANLSSEPSGCDTESVGNAPQRQDHGRESRDMGSEAGQGRCGDHAADCTGEGLGNAPHQRRRGLDDESSETCSRQARGHANGTSHQQGQGNRQVEPPLGGNADGNTDRLGYAELFTTCDNRTDELRLLGNGVAPATAERAFRVLMEELSQEK